MHQANDNQDQISSDGYYKTSIHGENKANNEHSSISAAEEQTFAASYQVSLISCIRYER